MTFAGTREATLDCVCILDYYPLGDYWRTCTHKGKPHKCFDEKLLYWHTGVYRRVTSRPNTKPKNKLMRVARYEKPSKEKANWKKPGHASIDIKVNNCRVRKKRLRCTCPVGKWALSFPCPTFNSTCPLGKLSWMWTGLGSLVSF